MLVLISIGLADERDMSLRALEAARECDILLSEFYTNKINTNTEKLSNLIGKPVREISRKDLEENFNWILEEAKNKNVGILVGGDCLVATTHYSIVLEAKKLEIPVKIIHSSSIISAIGETGLHLKKFGPYVTIPFPEKTKKSLPESIYNTIKDNKNRGLHTLCLLDIADEPMSVKQGLEILLELEKKLGQRVIDENTEIIVCSRLGHEDKKIEYGNVKNLMEKDFKEPCVIIIPSNLHFTEATAISFLP